REVARRLRAADVEELVVHVGREAEEAAFAPLERLLALLVIPDAGRASAGDDVDRLVVHVALGGCRAAGWNLDDVDVRLVFAVQIKEGALYPFARPVPDLQGFHVSNVDAPGRGRALFSSPLRVGIDSLNDRSRFSNTRH